MSSGASPSISEKAALTILLHAAKYPAAAVNGVLLGQADPSKGILQITAAVPLLHSFLSLAPSLETALYLVDAYARQSTSDLRVVGYYHANAGLSDTELTSVARQVAETIQQQDGFARAVQVNNSALTDFYGQKQGAEEAVLELWQKEGSRDWSRQSNALSCQSSQLAQRFQELHSSKAHLQLVDFDDHLNDISRPWLEQVTKPL